MEQFQTTNHVVFERKCTERWNPLLGIAASSWAQRSGAGSSARNHSPSAHHFFNPGTSPGDRDTSLSPLDSYYNSYYPPQFSWSNPSIYLSSSTKAKRSSSAKYVLVFVRLLAVSPASLMRLMVHSPTVASAVGLWTKHHGINGGLPAATQHPGLSNWPPCVHGQPPPTPPLLLWARWGPGILPWWTTPLCHGGEMSKWSHPGLCCSVGGDLFLPCQRPFSISASFLKVIYGIPGRAWSYSLTRLLGLRCVAECIYVSSSGFVCQFPPKFSSFLVAPNII